MQDCSLLIKICPKEFLISDACINHIVNRLEYGQKFKERLVVVDGENSNRNRIYSKENILSLKNKLKELEQEKIIDKIIYCNNNEGLELYNKYFENYSKNAYAKNGLQLLTTLKSFENINTKYMKFTMC